MSYIAANGQEITDEMVERWCAAYESGGFPEGERTVGGVVMGRPPLSSDKTVTVAIKVPSGMKVAMARRAEERGTTLSAYARSIIASDLLATG